MYSKKIGSKSLPALHSAGAGRIAAMVLAAGLAAPALAQDRAWNTADGQWSVPGNWSPVGVPLPTSIAFIGSSAAAENAIVTLNQNDSIAGLHLTDGMRLHMNGFWLTVSGNTVVSGVNLVLPEFAQAFSTLQISDAGGTAFVTNNLSLDDSGRSTLSGGAEVVVNDLLSIGENCDFTGNGQVTLNGSGTTLVNRGTIRGYSEGGLSFIQTDATGRYDLDGTTGDGELLMLGDNSYLEFSGLGLTDQFSGFISLFHGSRLHMSLAEGWSADTQSVFHLGSADPAAGPTRITGSALSFAGELNVTGDEGNVDIEVDVQITAGASVIVAASSRLDFGQAVGNETTINGGTFSLGEDSLMTFERTAVVTGGTFALAQGADVDFFGPTLVESGSFATSSTLVAQGSIDFHGFTTWDGDASFSGAARQLGNAAVVGSTVIDADVFDMDGLGGVVWDINANLVVNALQINAVAGNNFSGTLDIGAGVFTQLVVNLNDPAAHWVMDGTMVLAGEAAFFNSRLNGSLMESTGAMTLAGGRAQLSADVRFADGTLSLIAASADLRLMGRTELSDQVEVQGAGTLRNGVLGELTLLDGSTLNLVGLVNQGVLEIGEQTGIASVDRLNMTTDSTFRVDLGGPIAGTQHDVLIVGGSAAEIAGSIEVRLVDLGGGLFKPEIGDTFTVLTALGGVSGTFDADPMTASDGSVYSWVVEYGSNQVVLRLDDITHPCIADFDGSGTVDVPDIFRFLSQWFAGDSSTDIDGSGIVAVPDIFAFLSLWFAGCP